MTELVSEILRLRFCKTGGCGDGGTLLIYSETSLEKLLKQRVVLFRATERKLHQDQAVPLVKFRGRDNLSVLVDVINHCPLVKKVSSSSPRQVPHTGK